MRILRSIIALVLAVWMPSYSLGQTQVKGNVKVSGNVTLGAALVGVQNFFAQLPINWVNSGLTTGTGFCSPPGGTFDATKTMPGDYAATFAGLIQAKTDQAAANAWWKLVVTAGTNINGSAHDANGALLSWPTGTTSTKCLVVQSSNHITDATMPCSQLFPTVRDANCTTSAAKFWKFTLNAAPGSPAGNLGMFFPYGSNYILIEDMEIAPLAGSAQSQNGSTESLQVVMEGDHIGVAGSWVHGWNPGDAGQPGIGSSNAAVDNATGVCLAWNRSAVVNTSGTAVTWVSGDRFGMDLSDGTHSAGYPAITSGATNHVTISGVNYGIATHDPVTPTTGDINATLAASAGTQTGVTMTWQNPRTGYAVGCGDDSRGVQLNCTNCFIGFSQINKIHWWGSESHALSYGFSNGPIKIFYVWVEPGSNGLFSGGGDIDTRGGPVQDVEAGNFFDGRDLDWRFLTGGAQHSPGPPFGCGPLGGVAANRSTCPFTWAVKNNLEMKECNRCLYYGFIIDGSWPDGQSGSLITVTPRTTSGGGTRGIYDPPTGLPMEVLQNIRFENFWCRNAPQCFGTSARSLSDPGNGGGLSGAVHNVDFINGVISNTADSSQWGTMDDLGNWSTNGQSYIATVTRSGGIATAVTTPIKNSNYDYSTAHGGATFKNAGVIDNAVIITSVASVADVVTMKFNNARKDPPIGGQAVMANVPGWNGTFTISGVQQTGSSTVCSTDNHGGAPFGGNATYATQPQPCVVTTGANAGTFGDTIIYTDSINHPGTATLCTNKATCDALGIQLVIDTLAFKMTDIAIGDGVYTHDCTDPTFNTGATGDGIPTFNPALSPTDPLGLTVYYANAGSGSATCILENSAGWPSSMSITNITALSDSSTAINSNGQAGQHFRNQFLHNVFAETGANADLTCSGANEGTGSTAAAKCWDAGLTSTFQFFDSVLQGRSSGLWPVLPLGSPINFFPTTVTCSGATADPTCLGWTGFMSGVSFPTANCPYSSPNPLNCPLMAAPWSSNLSLTSITPVATSSYKTQGANLTNLQNAFSQTIYVCPVGVNCGTGPKPD